MAHPRIPIQSGDQPVQGAAAASGHLADGAEACTGQGEGPAGSLGWGRGMAPCPVARGSARSTGRRTPRPVAAPAASPSAAGCKTKHGPPKDIENCVCFLLSPGIETTATTMTSTTTAAPLTSRSRPRSSEM